jgi:hypothetical protein
MARRPKNSQARLSSRLALSAYAWQILTRGGTEERVHVRLAKNNSHRHGLLLRGRGEKVSAGVAGKADRRRRAARESGSDRDREL